MQHLIELWSPKAEWLSMSEPGRAAYMDKVLAGIGEHLSQGLKFHAAGLARNDVPNTVQYQFFLVWDAPDAALIRDFLRTLTGFGWFDYFDQVNVVGEGIDIGQLRASHVNPSGN